MAKPLDEEGPKKSGNGPLHADANVGSGTHFLRPEEEGLLEQRRQRLARRAKAPPGWLWILLGAGILVALALTVYVIFQ